MVVDVSVRQACIASILVYGRALKANVSLPCLRLVRVISHEARASGDRSTPSPSKGMNSAQGVDMTTHSGWWGIVVPRSQQSSYRSYPFLTGNVPGGLAKD